MKWMEIDQDYLRTGTAIGSLAFHEHQLRFLVFPEVMQKQTLGEVKN